MKSKKFLPDISPHSDFDDTIKILKQLSDRGKQKVMKLINDVAKEDIVTEDNNLHEEKPVYYCLRCGKPIKRLNSINHNMGPICYKHYCEEQKKKTKTLF